MTQIAIAVIAWSIAAWIELVLIRWLWMRLGYRCFVRWLNGVIDARIALACPRSWRNETCKAAAPALEN